MSKTFLPGIVVPGAYRIRDEHGVPVNIRPRLHSRKTVPAWSMPEKGSYTVLHFKSAAARRKFYRGEIGPDQAYKRVTVYRGVEPKVARMIRDELKRRRLMEMLAEKLKAAKESVTEAMTRLTGEADEHATT